MLVENCLVIELKAIEELLPVHELQLVNYLNTMKIDNGLLVNFGGKEIQFSRKYRLYNPKAL